MSEKIQEITSVADLLAEVRNSEEQRPDAGLGESLFWYRGHPDKNWELQPGVLREKQHANKIHEIELLKSPNKQDKWNNVLENERTINRRFRNEAYLYFGKVPEIRLYFAAQHHG